jgi:NAD(P)-dependent dehydrogenase (short-subunit alcohol dehydrogenase family)
VVLVTGANSGTGYETAKAYYEHGAKVLVACRSEERASRAIENIKKGGSVDILGKVNFTPAKGKTGSLEYINLDLADLDSVDKAAKAILDKETRLDVFFANAGIMAVPPGQYTKQGYSLQFGTNVGTVEVNGQQRWLTCVPGHRSPASYLSSSPPSTAHLQGRPFLSPSPCLHIVVRPPVFPQGQTRGRRHSLRLDQAR